MSRFWICFPAALLLTLIIAFSCESSALCEANRLNSPFASDNVSYYFASDSGNYLSPDNQITISIDNNGRATVQVRLHAKAYYPTGIGDQIEIPVPYPQDRVTVTSASVSNTAQAAYNTVGTKDKTIIQVKIPGSPEEVYVEAVYAVNNVYDGKENKHSFRLLLSSFTTEISVNLMTGNRESWINRKSIELSPTSSEDTYFLINEEVLPFAVYLVLSNVNPQIIELSLRMEAAPYGLEMMPLYALAVSLIPAIFFLLLANITRFINSRRRVGVVVLAYRNLHRRLGRLFLTLIGVSIPSMLLVQILVQNTLSQKMLGPGSTRGEWYIALILIVVILIGGFQVFNTVFSSVLERIRELGVMKAIGFNPSYIFKMIMAESAIIGIIAGLLGSLLAAMLAILSAQIFYGLSLPNTVYTEIITNSFGETNLGNPFVRNSAIAMGLLIVTSAVLTYLWPSEYEGHASFFMVLSFQLFLILVRPTDPFTVSRLVELAPSLLENILVGVLFTVILSIAAGSYVAYQAGKIEPSEAMRHV